MHQLPKFKLPLKHSIFFKLSILIVVSIFVTLVTVTGFGALIVHHYFPGNMHKYYTIYMDYVIDDWGIPPDVRKMQALCEKYNLRLYYQGPTFSWSYGFPNVNIKTSFKATQISHSFTLSQGFLLVKKEQAGHIFILAFDTPRSQLGIYYIVLLMLVLTLVLAIIYYRIRKLLNPLHHLLSGVNNIQKGDFSYRIPVTQSDELGTLSDSFNRMTSLLKNMIKSKDQLLLDVSHELRSPLTRIKVALEFIAEQNIKEAIAGDVAEMEHMILELLETERMKSEYGKVRFKRVDIVSLLRELVKSYSVATVQVQCNLPAHPIFLLLDEMRIRMLFKNLIDNALRYAETGAETGEPASEHVSELPVTIEVLDEPVCLTVQVRDQGIGIPEKDLPYLFEPFYRIDASRSRETGGYGLGLYICKKIVEQHGGEISIRSRVHEGTTVIVKLSKEQLEAHGASNANHP